MPHGEAAPTPLPPRAPARFLRRDGAISPARTPCRTRAACGGRSPASTGRPMGRCRSASEQGLRPARRERLVGAAWWRRAIPCVIGASGGALQVRFRAGPEEIPARTPCSDLRGGRRRSAAPAERFVRRSRSETARDCRTGRTGARVRPGQGRGTSQSRLASRRPRRVAEIMPLLGASTVGASDSLVGSGPLAPDAGAGPDWVRQVRKIHSNPVASALRRPRQTRLRSSRPPFSPWRGASEAEWT